MIFVCLFLSDLYLNMEYHLRNLTLVKLELGIFFDGLGRKDSFKKHWLFWYVFNKHLSCLNNAAMILVRGPRKAIKINRLKCHTYVDDATLIRFLTIAQFQRRQNPFSFNDRKCVQRHRVTEIQRQIQFTTRFVPYPRPRSRRDRAQITARIYTVE